MGNDNGNPESLHNVGKKGTGMRTDGKFVNPGTPENALVSEKDLATAVVSGKGTDTLRNNLIKDK